MIDRARIYLLASGIVRNAGSRAFTWLNAKRRNGACRTVSRLPTPAMAEPATHWARLSSVIDQAAQATRVASELQATAQAKLDVADYAMQRLMTDLARVMPTMAAASATFAPVRTTAPARIRLAA